MTMSNLGKCVPPMPKGQKKKEVNKYKVLREARQLLFPSPTPSVAGSRFVAIADGERDRIDRIAIGVSENEGDKVGPAEPSNKEFVDFNKSDFSLW